MQDSIVGRQTEVLSKGNTGYKTAANVDSPTRASRQNARGFSFLFFFIMRNVDPSSLLNILPFK